MSFLKFRESESGLHWSRADKDRAPYRGQKVPLLKEEEYEDLVERVDDCKVGIFDTTDPTHTQHGRSYIQVLDGLKAGWFKLLVPRKFRWTKRNGKETVLAYVEWSEPYMQLPTSALDRSHENTVVLEDEIRYGQSAKTAIRQPRPLRGQAKASKRRVL